jgi:cellulose synthase/poly-beta-1,6-N-acetylglucosamine synthase-like glycosyltransferase
MLPNERTGMNHSVSEFMVAVANYVRPLGLQRMGCSCGRKGAGMAFPSNFGNGDLGEDLKLSVDRARKGIPTLFCPEAVTTSYFPTTAKAMQSQRIRCLSRHSASNYFGTLKW